MFIFGRRGGGGITLSGLGKQTRRLHRPTVAIFNIGWLCVVAALALSFIGYFSISGIPRPGEPDYATRHLVFIFVGIVAACVVAVPHYKWARVFSYPFLILVLLMLIFVLIPFVPDSIVRPRNGARRWISLVVTDFQPSELAKIAYVVALASYLRFRSNYRRLGGLMLPLALTFIPMGLVLIEPDLGTALLFLPTLFAMLVAAGAKLRHIMLVVILGLSLAPAMYPLLKPHQANRIKALYAQIIGDPQYENGIGYQGARAMTLTGAGQLTGAGERHGAALITFNKLPEDHNDMIFAVVACRWGMMGALVIWGLFITLVGGGLLVAAQTKDPFARLVPVGISALLLAQMTINTGMTIGIMPITGMTLPFVSYGGSSLVTAWIMVGLMFNIGMRRPRYLAREAFEFSEEDDEDV
ncbi:MAG: rod shape-determining protein RodA [Planctomycetes bacterium]|nr:rod shape-determining protein RodA [Planctomycetota bacterium]